MGRIFRGNWIAFKSYELPAYEVVENKDVIAEIDKAIEGKYTLIVFIHQVVEEPGAYDISVSKFNSIVDYIETNNIRTQTVSEYYNEMFV